MYQFSTLLSSRLGRGLLVVCVFALVGIGATNLEGTSQRARAERWAASHTGSLPTTLGELAAFPPEYRTAIVKVMPAATRSRLWQDQLQWVMASQPLTGEQRAFVQRVMSLATPASFEPNAVTQNVCEDVLRLFPDAAQRETVRRLGAASAPAASWQSRLVAVRERVHQAVSVSADEVPCNCANVFCDCKFLQATCDPVPCTVGGDCGCIWIGPCDGLCRQNGGMNRVIK